VEDLTVDSFDGISEDITVGWKWKWKWKWEEEKRVGVERTGGP
jgi:hypothetical protein